MTSHKHAIAKRAVNRDRKSSLQLTPQLACNWACHPPRKRLTQIAPTLPPLVMATACPAAAYSRFGIQLRRAPHRPQFSVSKKLPRIACHKETTPHRGRRNLRPRSDSLRRNGAVSTLRVERIADAVRPGVRSHAERGTEESESSSAQRASAKN